jgi:hypothetical protein
MFQSSWRTHRLQSRYRPEFDRLESRIALAAGGGTDPTDLNSPAQNAAADVADPTQAQPLAVDLVDPAPGSILHASPSTLTLQFNRPIFPDTLSSDVGIVQVDADGNPTGWYTIPDQLTLDDSATRLTVDVGDSLPPGQYQVWVFGSSDITDVDGNRLVPDGNNLVLGDFEVEQAGVALDDAIDLGTPGTTPIAVPGTLDFQANPYAVSLYRVHLDPGHFWRLGLEVTAQRDGGTLDTALALFDDQGRPIAVDETGRKDAPMDPYLFAGLQPGTYYIGVSGTGNLPGPFGGYDPSTGSAGSVPQTQPGGPYTLHVVADPEDSPPQLRSLSVDHADSHSAIPTGLTLAFTRAIGLGGDITDLSATLNQSIEVSDGQGRIWPIQAIGYDEAQARVSYLFEDPLPAGHYTIRLPAQGGLVDLAGLSPTALGEPPGVLGAFNVPAQAGPVDPQDLGALLPQAASEGRSLESALGPGESITYRIVLTVPTLYQFEIQAEGGDPSVQVAGGGISRTLDLGGTNDTLLAAGEYTIRIQDTGTQAMQARLDLRAAVIESELVLANGVGQGPGLSLRLITFPGPVIEPSPASPTPMPVIGSSPASPTPTPVIGSSPASPTPTPPIEPAAFSPTATPDPAPSSSAILSPLPAPSTGPQIDLRGRDPASTTDSPSRGSESARSQPVLVAMLSYLSLGTDLIGRPSLGSAREASSELGIPARGEPMRLGGVAQGPLPLTVRGLWMGLDEGRLDASDLAPDVVPVPEGPMAVVAVLGWSRMVPLIDGLPHWAVRIGTGAWAWAESAPSDRPRSESSWADAIPNGPRTALVWSEPGLDRGAGPEKAERMDEANSWVEFLAPVIAALSAALAAQVGRRFARWWRRRDRRPARPLVRRLNRGSATGASEPVPADPVAPWIDELDLNPNPAPGCLNLSLCPRSVVRCSRTRADGLWAG